MFRAVFARTLKAGVTDEQFIQAWMPEHFDAGSYPAATTISHDVSDARRIISVFDIDTDADHLTDVIASLVHPDSAARLAEIVESTQLAAVFEDTTTLGK